MKKFFAAGIFLALIIFGAAEKSEAKDIWIAGKGEHIQYYIVAETFQRTVGENFSVMVKSVYKQGNISTNRTWDARTYEFEIYPDNQWYYSNEEPKIWYPITHDYIAEKICNFFVKAF